MTRHFTETLVATKDLDAALEQSLTTLWDAKIYHWDNSKYPFNEWILGRVRGMGYKLDDLSFLHEAVPLKEVYNVTKQLCADTNLPEFRRMLNRFVREQVVTQGQLRLPVAVQRFMNVRVMLPTTPELFFPYHTGLLYGHGIASRSMWLPFVDVTAVEDRNRSMQIIGIKRSRELIKYAIDHRLSMQQMTDLFAKESWQIKAGPGSGCFFTQENIHGSGRPNDTGKTRVSMDFRIAEGIYGDYLGRKIPGGLFPSDSRDRGRGRSACGATAPGKGVRQWKAEYLLRRQQYGGDLQHPGTPPALHAGGLLQKEEHRVQLRAVRSRRHGTPADVGHLVNDRECNIVMYSIFALPEEENERNQLLETAVKRGGVIHFVNEDLQLTSADDLREIKRYLEFSKYGRSRLPIGLPLSGLSKSYFDKWAASLAEAG